MAFPSSKHINPGTVLRRKSRMGRDLPLHIPHTITQCRKTKTKKTSLEKTRSIQKNKQQLELITSRTPHRGPRTLQHREKEAQHATADTTFT